MEEEKNKIEQVIERFDFKRVLDFMTAVNWTWHDGEGSNGVPTLAQLRECAKELLSNLVFNLSGAIVHIETGGFVAEKLPDGSLRLRFVVESAESGSVARDILCDRLSLPHMNPDDWKKSERAVLAASKLCNKHDRHQAVEAVADQRKPVACRDCGLPYRDFPIDLNLPRAQWLLIHPDDGGVLCAMCMLKRIAEKVEGATVVRAVVEVTPTKR